MSDAAVMTRPLLEEEVQWIEMDDGTFPFEDVDVALDLEVNFIELGEAPTELFESQDAMRFGTRAYTSDQAEVIRLAVSERTPLRVAPLPLDDE
jgi:hypothetical protein